MIYRLAISESSLLPITLTCISSHHINPENQIMKTPETLFTIAATTFGILTAMTALFSPGAIASNYSAGKTTLNIQERGDNHPGGYSTEIQGRKWSAI